MYDSYFALLCSNKIQAFNIHVCIYLHFRILILYNLYSFKHYVRACTKIRLYMYTFTICWLRGWCDAILIKTKIIPHTIRHDPPPPGDSLGVLPAAAPGCVVSRPCFFIASMTPAKLAVFFLAEPLGVEFWARTRIVGAATSSIKSKSLFLVGLCRMELGQDS